MARTIPEDESYDDGTKMENKKNGVHDIHVKEEGKEEEKENEPKIVSKLHEIIKLALELEDKGDYDGARKLWQSAIRRTSRGEHCKGRTHCQKKEVEYKDETFHLPLHIAVSGNAPFDVIEAIVNAYPQACEMKVDFECSYPLHMACMCSKSKQQRSHEKVIRFLMEKYPRAINELMEGDATALHLLLEHKPSEWLVKRMVDLAIDPSNAQVKLEDASSPDTIQQAILKSKSNFILSRLDCDKQVPLHVAIDYNASNEVIHFLYEKYPKGAEMSTVIGFTCLHLAIIRKKVKFIKLFAKEFPILLKKRTDKSLHLWETPLHMLFRIQKDSKKDSKKDPKLLFSKSDTERICYKLLTYYKQLVGGERGKMNYLISRALDKSNKSILNVAKTAQRKNLISEGLFQMLKDASSGNEFRLQIKKQRATTDGESGNGNSYTSIQKHKKDNVAIVKREPSLETEQNIQSGKPREQSETADTMDQNKPIQHKESKLQSKRIIQNKTPNNSLGKEIATNEIAAKMRKEQDEQMYRGNTVDQNKTGLTEKEKNNQDQLDGENSTLNSKQNSDAATSQYDSFFDGDISTSFRDLLDDDFSAPESEDLKVMATFDDIDNGSIHSKEITNCVKEKNNEIAQNHPQIVLGSTEDQTIEPTVLGKPPNNSHHINATVETELEKTIESKKMSETGKSTVVELETQTRRNGGSTVTEIKQANKNFSPSKGFCKTYAEKESLRCFSNVGGVKCNTSTIGTNQSKRIIGNNENIILKDKNILSRGNRSPREINVDGYKIPKAFGSTAIKNTVSVGNNGDLAVATMEASTACALTKSTSKKSRKRKSEHYKSEGTIGETFNIQGFLQFTEKPEKKVVSSVDLRHGKRKRWPLTNSFDELIIL